MRFGQIGKQSGRALFQNVQHQLEAGCSSIVRIGDMVVNTATAEIRHQTDLGHQPLRSEPVLAAALDWQSPCR